MLIFPFVSIILYYIIFFANIKAYDLNIDTKNVEFVYKI